jgi:hypothetical protein
MTRRTSTRYSLPTERTPTTDAPCLCTACAARALVRVVLGVPPYLRVQR